METQMLEGLADAFYRDAGMDPSRPAGILRLVRNHPGLTVHFDPYYRGTAELTGDTVRVRSQLPALTIAWRVAHETGEWILERERCCDEFVEQYADNLAGALIAPRASVLAMRGLWGVDLQRFARATASSETIMALRHSEVTEIPTAVLLGGRVKRRDPLNALPSDRQLQRLARTPGDAQTRVLPLTDARNRTAILVDNYM